MDYSVKDSSLFKNPYGLAEFKRSDNTLRVGMVREKREVNDGTTRYLVEVFIGGNQVPVSCRLMTKWGGPYNYEEYTIRGWAKLAPPGAMLPTTASTYDLRSGDQVIVGFLNGSSREGVILGGLKHESRDEELADDIEYISVFNGLETKIDAEGAYTVTFQGTPINETVLDATPGSPIAPPQYNPLTSGSFFGFDNAGSFEVSDGDQSIKITKDAVSGMIEIVSGKNTITMAGTAAQGEMTIATDAMTIDTMETAITALTTFSVEATQSVAIKGTQVAIGNDSIELVDAIIQLIDAFGGLVVTSPVGSCTPLMSAPTWAAQVVPLQIQLNTLKGSL
jgi:hypothetical protein